MVNEENMRILAAFVSEYYDAIDECDKCASRNNWMQGIACVGCLYNGGKYSNFEEPQSILIAREVLNGGENGE